MIDARTRSVSAGLGGSCAPTLHCSSALEVAKTMSQLKPQIQSRIDSELWRPDSSIPNSHHRYRERCFAVYGQQCAACGEAESDDEDECLILAHHIDADRSNGSVENLVPLCKSCHEIVHSPNRFGSDRDNRLLVDLGRKYHRVVEEKGRHHSYVDYCDICGYPRFTGDCHNCSCQTRRGHLRSVGRVSDL